MWWDRHELPAYCCRCGGGGTLMLVPEEDPYPAYLCTFCFWVIKEEKEGKKLSANNGQPYKCPVCDGKGIVPGGFYMSIGDASTFNRTTEPCRSCDSKGIVYARR